MSHELGASIIVPSRGGAGRLPVLLSALSRQDTDDFEVIVVLDGDTDNSETILDRFAANIEVALRKVTLPENRGRAAALNAGAEIARGRVLIRCDDDLEPQPDYVSKHIAAHSKSVVGVVGLCRNVFPETTYARVYGRAADERFRKEAVACSSEEQWRYWAGNVSVLRSVHQEIGGYDERFRRYGWEDVDYGYRLLVSGVPVRIEPSLTTPHYVAATTTSVRAHRALHSGAARETFIGKHGPDALGVPTPDRGVWSALVTVASTLATETTLRRAGATVDAAAAVLPVWMSEKLVALVVESAGRAGIRYPHRARARF
ncbi:glycosyltransferase family 2 protein [Arthrobacter sp. ISL-28]|uniref:glycosyltransferase family 2 protein n=1 Tax=Arthrobacter sp. ISL-28 TaxID=2819108 RepID=UPI001BE693FB|nr:glycosyltransferase family A protein [Arthrobacter sp. ISL-28]MBT2519651.1 glycosyltransferase family 2 protein [Arthrobacter sp. ISL-28]